MDKWNGKNKALTFSFDDGTMQDIRLIEILNKYGLKATFNINSSLLGLKNELDRNGVNVRHDKVSPFEIKNIYKGHEIAAHSLTHPSLPEESKDAVIWQVEQDRKVLESLVGYPIVGMAYPGGWTNNETAEILRKYTKIKYARTVISTYNFDLQADFLMFNPTVYYIEVEKMFELGEKFVSLVTDKPQLFYIWGHSFEMDANYISWEKFEKFCKLISGRDDIFYGTNAETLL